jgi:hypothetical protein
MNPERDNSTGGGEDAVDSRIEALLEKELIKQVEIIGFREGGIVDCWVPTGLIDHEEVPVKDEWAGSLAEEMREIAESKGGTGQLSPIILGLIEGEDKLKIIDGFHRDAALKMNGEQRVYAAIQLTDWDGLYDVRIFTAKDHAHVRFSRVVQWIREVWQFSGLADKMTVERAVLLYRFDTSGAKLHLDPSDVQTAKAWVARKEQQWGMAAMTIHSHLKIAESVDPKLIHSTREKQSGRKLEAPTQAILTVFSNEIPDCFDLQNLVMGYAMQHNLTGPKVKSLCQLVADCSIEEARIQADGIDWDSWEPSYGKTASSDLRRAYDPRHRGPKVLAKAEWEVKNIARRVELIKKRGEEVDGEMAANIRAAIEKAESLAGDLGRLSIELSGLMDRERNNAPAESSGNGGHRVEEPIIERAVAKPVRVEPAPQRPPTELVEEDSDDGLRADIMSYLKGDGGIDAVNTYTQRQLMDCFRKINGQKIQPSDWRNRFAIIQQLRPPTKPRATI